jgi:Phage integrase, N-terminal SAM-like domain
MGALRQKMIEEMKLRNFSHKTEQSYVSAMVGLVKHYRRSPDQITQDEIRSYVAPQGTGSLPEFAQRGDLGDEVLLSPDVGLERQAVVYSAEEAKLAAARGVKPEGSGAFVVGRGKAA